MKLKQRSGQVWLLAVCGVALNMFAGAQTKTAGGGRGLAGASVDSASVLMLSDLHFDPLRDPAKAARLAEAPVEQWDAILKGPNSALQGERFAALQTACGARGLDTDYGLLGASLKAAGEQAAKIQFVTVSGDLLVHGFECRYATALKEQGAGGYAAFAAKTAVYVMGRVEAAFPKVPVYIGLGNNDSGCGDYRMDVHDRFLAATSRAVLTGLRGANASELKQAREDYETGGYFAVTLGVPAQRMRLLVLNDIFMSRHYATCGKKSEDVWAVGEMSWLARELDAAQARGERVWVMGHIPPSVDIYTTLAKMRNVCGGARTEMFLGSDELADTLVKHADVVTLGIFAHTHFDEMRLLRREGSRGEVPLKLVSSVSPINGNRPSFTVGQIDLQTGGLRDYEVYAAAEATGTQAKWAREYGFRETYHVTDFGSKSLDEVVAGFRGDGAGSGATSQAYQQFFSPGGGFPLLALVWPQYGCALDHDTEAGFKSCLCAEK